MSERCPHHGGRRVDCAHCRETDLRAEIERLQDKAHEFETTARRLRAALTEIGRMSKDGYDARDLGREARRALKATNRRDK